MVVLGGLKFLMSEVLLYLPQFRGLVTDTFDEGGRGVDRALAGHAKQTLHPTPYTLHPTPYVGSNTGLSWSLCLSLSLYLSRSLSLSL